MDSHRDLLLDLWREACRHLSIEESAAEIASLLARTIPLMRLYVLALDPSEDAMTLRAVGPERVPAGSERESRKLGSAARRSFGAWIQAGKVAGHRRGGHAPHVPSYLPHGLCEEGDWIAVPLNAPDGVSGILVLRTAPGKRFELSHLRLATLLIEPFSVALANDLRLQELTALREAAEADQRSVLSRIGRDDLVETIIGEDGGLRPVMERVELVAASDVPVLILGETGSGKEVIARAIHDRSLRAAGPFIRVNCGAIPGELVDSELFGHEKGAFTGATATRRGWFERADRGTLLLDEIGELPLPAQVRLLRVLQEGTFERVGGERSIRVDVRIVAATHRDLPSMVQRGRFREDLWYRITGFPILLPPLRERREDIPELAEHFVERAARRFGLRPLALSREDLRLLEAYAWPGNIRELASVIDRAAILGRGETLEVARALGGALRSDPREGVARPADADAAADGGARADQGATRPLSTLDAAMRRHIEAALVETRGQIEGERGAARLLDINPHTLRSRMRKLGIEWAAYR